MNLIGDLIGASSNPETASAFNSLVVGGGIAVLFAFVIAISFLVVVYQLVRTTKDNIVMNKEFTDSILSILDEMKRLSGLSYLSKDSLYEMFKLISTVHVQEKGHYIEKTLVKNDIHNRKEQIKKNIEIKFRDITQKECNTMSMFNTIYGDVGKIFNKWIEWDVFLPSVYCIVFSDNEIEQKLADLQALMDGYLSDFWEQLTK